MISGVRPDRPEATSTRREPTLTDATIQEIVGRIVATARLLFAARIFTSRPAERAPAGRAGGLAAAIGSALLLTLANPSTLPALAPLGAAIRRSARAPLDRAPGLL